MEKKHIEHKAGDVVKPRQKSLRKAGVEIVYRPLSELHPNPKNPRKATQEAIEKLAESLKENPGYFEMRPVLLSDRTGKLVIIDGEQRSKAAKLLGLEVVPTILKSGLTEAEEDEILIRGNTHSGIWVEDKLKKWTNEKLESWDAPKWNIVDERAIEGLFVEHETNTKKSTFIVVEFPYIIDTEPIKRKIKEALNDFHDYKIK